MTESEGKGGEESIRGHHSDSFESTELSGLRIAAATDINPSEGRENPEVVMHADDSLIPVWQKIAFEVEVHSAADDNNEEIQRKTENNEDEEEENDIFHQKSTEERERIGEEQQEQRSQYFNFTVVEDVVKDSVDSVGPVDSEERTVIGENKVSFELLGPQSEGQLTTVFKSVDAEEVSQASYEAVGMTMMTVTRNAVETTSKADETLKLTSAGTVNTNIQTLHYDDDDHHQQQQQQLGFPSNVELEQLQVSSSELSNVSLVKSIAAETSYKIPTAFLQVSQQNSVETQLLARPAGLPSILNQAKLLQGSLTPTTLILIDPSKDCRKQLGDCMLIQNGTDGNSPIFLLQLTSQPLQTAVVNPEGGNNSVQHFLGGDPGFLFHSNLRIHDNSALQGISAGEEQRGLTNAVIAAGDNSMPGVGFSRLEGAEAQTALNAGSSRKSDRLKSKKPLGWKTSINLEDDISRNRLPPPSRKRRTPNRSNLKHPGDQEKLAKYGDDDNESICQVVGAPDALTGHSSTGEGRGKQQQQQQLPMSVAASTGNVPVITGSSTRMFTCMTCNKDFTTEKYLSMHISLHINSNVGSPGSLTSTTASSSGTGLGTIDELPIRRTKATVPGSTAQWTCKICEKTFAQNSNYKNHIRTHSNERPFVCEICSIGFKERYHLKKHVLFKHTSELKEKCHYCDKCFKDSTAVRAHERTHSDQRPYPCPRCDKTFKTSECLWHHVNRSKTCGKSLGDMPPPPCMLSTNQPPPRGLQRPGVSRGRQQLGLLGGEECFVPAVAHEQVVPPVESLHLPSEEEDEEERRVVYQRFTPEAATLSQLNTTSSSWHIPGVQAVAVPTAGQDQRGDNGRAVVEEGPVLAVKVEMEMNIFDYDLTGINSPETSSLEDYCEEFERETEEDDEEEISISATGVGSVFPGSTATQTPSSPQGLVAGTSATPSLVQTPGTKRLGGSGGRLDCGTCGKQCSTQSAYEKHSIVHSESRPHRCDACNVGFKLKVHLKKHNLYRHSDEYPCECSICGKRFKDSSAVRLHERIHSTERPFKCHCGKGFKTRENLWGHRHRGPCDDKPGNFLLQNLRVFDSDIGPIWGVPLAADQVPTPPVEADDLESNQTTTCRHHENEAIGSNAYDFLIQGAAPTLSLNRGQFLKTLVKKEATTDGHDNMSSSSSFSFVTRPSPHIFWSSQSSLFSNPSSSLSSLSSSGAHPPTAVVVPIKRETNEASTTTTTLTTTSLSSGEKCSLPPFETLVTTHRPSLTQSSSSSSAGVSNGVTAGVMGVSDRCQKVLLARKESSLQTKLPGIQQLFQGNPVVGQSSLSTALNQYPSTHQVLHAHDRGGADLSLLPPLLPVLLPPPYHPSCPADVIITGTDEMSATGVQTSTSASFWGEEGGGEGGDGGEEKLVSPPGVDGKNCYALQWMTSLAQTASKQTRDGSGQFSMGPSVGRY